MPKLKGFILAGTFHQYECFLRECKLDRQEYRYLDNYLNIRGFRGLTVKRIGTYYERTDLERINMEIFASGLIEE